jgi:hypothetical protein
LSREGVDSVVVTRRSNSPKKKVILPGGTKEGLKMLPEFKYRDAAALD